jgi:hypothetical protein
MKKTKASVFVRYEFSDESGQPEGGDILELASMKKAQEMAHEILSVAHSDGVAVNLTIGENLPMFGYLKNKGMTRKDIDSEMVDLDSEENEEAPAQKKAGKKAGKKSGKKSAKNAAPKAAKKSGKKATKSSAKKSKV